MAWRHVTGLTSLVPGLSQKYVEFLREILPSARQFTVVGTVYDQELRQELEAAGRVLVQLALQHRLPGIYWTREYVEEGGLMTYSASLADLRRRAATYVDKILRGARPAELPIEQPTRFALVINLKTAQALGLTIPPTLLFQTDEVIQ